MVGRFYLPSGGTSDLNSLAIDAGWEHSAAAFYRAPLPQAKSNTALTDKAGTFPDTTAHQMCFAQFCSAQITAGYVYTTRHLCALVVGCTEANAAANAHLAYCLRVVSSDGATVRGTLRAIGTTAVEFTTSRQSRVKGPEAFTAVTAQANDRLILEVGVHGATPSISYADTLRFGDPTATADYNMQTAVTTDLVPWFDIGLEPFTEFGMTGFFGM